MRANPQSRAASQTGHSKQTVPDRILDVADRLFRANGYRQTGINQIIAESATAKASFYQYFPTKDDLGLAYLDRYGRENLAMLERLFQRYDRRPRDFIQAWVRILKREAREEELHGCPMANLRAQIAETSPALQAAVNELTRETLREFTRYLKIFQARGLLRDGQSPRIAARRLFAAYQGALQIWRLTGDVAALEDLNAAGDTLFLESA